MMRIRRNTNVVKKKPDFKIFLWLNVVFLLYSLAGVSSKTAMAYGFFSLKFFLFYGLSVFGLGIYAVMWQQILKVLPLTTAYPYKSITIAWGMLWGVAFFGEPFKWNIILSMLVISGGVLVMVSSDE